MEFVVIRTELLNELQLMMGVIEKKNTMPILANVFIAAENNELLLKATDLEVGIITRCPAQVVEPGELTVNHKQLQDMLGSFSGNQVTFSSSEGSMLDLVCDSARFSIETMSTLDFPSIPECSFEGALELQNGFFNFCIDRVLFSISTDSHKYALNGALLQIRDNEMNLVSTDGHRMSVINRHLGEGFANLDVIVPRKTLGELQRILKAESEEEKFLMGFEENRIFFKVGFRVLFSRLIDGKFPDYTKAIPVNNDRRFEFDRGLFQAILRRKSVLASEKSKLVRLSFKPGEMVVVLKNAERGESVDKMELAYDGEQMDLGFNVDYLHEFLKNMQSVKVEMFVRDETSQGLFKIPEDSYDVAYQHVIMPMRLG